MNKTNNIQIEERLESQLLDFEKVVLLPLNSDNSNRYHHIEYKTFNSGISNTVSIPFEKTDTIITILHRTKENNLFAVGYKNNLGNHVPVDFKSKSEASKFIKFIQNESIGQSNFENKASNEDYSSNIVRYPQTNCGQE